MNAAPPDSFEPAPPPADPAARSEPAVPAPKEPMFRIPRATGWLIAINLAVHIARVFLPPGQDDVVVEHLGFQPEVLLSPIGVSALSILTYQFLHGSWGHLAVNMIMLLALGAGVERPIGWRRFVLLYLGSGVGGAVLQTLATTPGFDPLWSGLSTYFPSLFYNPPRPDDLILGASAGVSGLFGALVIIWGLHRRGRRPMGILPMTLLWIGLTAVTGVFGIGAQGTPVAWIAHIGGFLTGMALGALMRPVPRG